MLSPGDAREVLTRTPQTVRALLGDISEGWAATRPGPEEWSPSDVVAHLIHGERTDWIPRMRILLEHGEERPFDPFDRTGWRQEAEGKTLPQLLDTFDAMRGENLAALDAVPLDEATLERRGTHPELGPVTLAELLATWAAHDLAHMAQILETMAKRYHDEVGPWRAYLPVLDRD